MNIERIIIDQKVHFGKPCIAGTRIPVYCVLELVQTGVSFDEIVSKYPPDITLDNIKTCVKYALEKQDRYLTIHTKMCYTYLCEI